MLPLFENSYCQFYSLNIEKSNPYIKDIHNRYNVIELEPYIHNANDTAALMKNMDIIVSVDSFTIHLAGALGIKSYLLLKSLAGWRWHYDKNKSKWYNSVRIIRQNNNSTLKETVNELSQVLTQEYFRFECNKYFSLHNI